VKGLAAVLLAACIVRHYSWEWFDAEVQALAWNAACSVVTTGLLWAFARNHWTREVAIVFAIWGIEEAQVFGCSVGRMFWAWPVAAGQEQCSAPLGIKVGAFTLLGIALFVATCKGLHYEGGKKGGK
jgi:hypothetical protein